MKLAGPPSGAVWIPPIVTVLANNRRIRCVWRNEVGGLTFAVRDGAPQYIKWAPASSGVDLRDEAERCRWARPFTPVPIVIDCGADNDGSWLVTEAIIATNAVTSTWRRDPTRAVTAIGEGLRALHDSLPVADCPFSWSSESRLRDARDRATRGQLDPVTWHPEHQKLTADDALELVSAAPSVDVLVVCHGDACAPNTLLDDEGRWFAHVDLGSLGIADRWADLAVATWSTQWNYGPGWEDLLLSAYGVNADIERTRYYRLLWDLGP